MPAPRKIAMVEDLTARMRSAAAIYFADYRGLSASKATELRAILRKENIQFMVVKKNLSILAAREAGIGEIRDYLQGQTALAFAHDDPGAPARVLRAFGKDNQDIPVITGLILDGQLVPAAQARELASLPSKEVLMGQLVSAMQQPMSRLASTLTGVMMKLVQTLSSLKEQKT